MGTNQRAIEPPSRWLQLSEGRALLEMTAFLASSPLLRILGRGDGHPVLVLPGFTTDDASTQPLRWVLRSQGYWVHGWRLGRNLGPMAETVDGIHARLEEVAEYHGRSVTLIGHSLGGIYAREMARRNADVVRQVITLGSPFRLTAGDRSAAQPLADLLQHRWSYESINFLQQEDDKPPLTVPSTAIYSRTDGVVRWHACIDSAGERHENIEVRSSHCGLAINPASVYAISDRLAQPDGQWTPFRPPPTLRSLYPRAAHFDPAQRLAG
jgi:pimeloyl-ACP methyl ester carboxylesterase